MTDANATLVQAIRVLQENAYAASLDAGWWEETEEQERPSEQTWQRVPEKLCLIHSEISEALEGHRRDLEDKNLPHREKLEVELADATIRILDLAGALGYDLGSAIIEKMNFNRDRPDHNSEAKYTKHGKRY